MKVKCLNCGLVYGIERWRKRSCPQCGEFRYVMKIEDFKKIPDSPKEDSSMVSLAKEFLRVVKEEGIKIVKQEDLIRDPFKAQREAIEKQMDTLDPFHYRIKRKEEGLAFEICDIFAGNKVRIRKIYLNGHIEGFEGNPLVTNHIAPKIMALKALLKQMNKDYRDFIEKNLLADLPIESVTLTKLYQAQLERINNIKI